MQSRRFFTMRKKIFTILVCVILLSVGVFTNSTVAFALTSGEVLSEERYTEPMVYQSKTSETFSFIKYEELEYNITPNSCPKYYYTGYSNACGAIAGADIIGYYDKYYTNLVPNYVTHYTSGKYKSIDSTYIPAVIGDLYTLMRTNVDDVGVSYNDFLSGLSQYISSKGYTVNYTSVFSNTTINYGAVKSAIDQRKVLALFCRATEICELSTSSNTEKIIITNINSAHIMVVYGYHKIRYTLTDGSIRTDTYLLVSTGLYSPQLAYYNINSDDVVQLQRIDIT